MKAPRARAVRGLAAVLGVAAAELSRAALSPAAPAPPARAVFAPYEEARAVLLPMREALPAGLSGLPEDGLSLAWPDWVRGADRAVRERLVQGEADAVVNQLLFGTSFTKAQRLTIEALGGHTSEDVASRLERRLSDLVTALQAPGADERLVLSRSLLESLGVNPGGPGGRDRVSLWLLENVARVRREQKGLAAELEKARSLPAATEQLAARSTLFRERGIALDTSLRPAFAIEEALADALARGLLTRDGVLRAAVVGPGLDFLDKAEGQDFYPPQSLQALALSDSLVRLGLSRPERLRVTAFDISPRVLDHLGRARSRAAGGEGYVLQLPRPREGWAAPFVAYWQRFGDAVAGPADAVKAPPSAGPLEVRAVRVRPEVAAAVRPVDLNVVYQRLELPPEERFDLVVATNILVYYDTFEQCLALANVARMTAVGGLFLSNNMLLELPGSSLRSVGYKTVVFSDKADDGEHVLYYRRLPDPPSR